VSELLSAFRRFSEAEEWPEEIAHLKGKVLTRKKDGAKYRVSRPSGQCIGRKAAAYLAPVGDNWPIISRSHWKTYPAILKDFTA
jgi:hypothetical protein